MSDMKSTDQTHDFYLQNKGVGGGKELLIYNGKPTLPHVNPVLHGERLHILNLILEVPYN